MVVVLTQNHAMILSRKMFKLFVKISELKTNLTINNKMLFKVLAKKPMIIACYEHIKILQL